MNLDLAVWLNLISTLAIVAALIFAAIQVRQANVKRSDQAAVTLIQTVQSEGWTRMLDLISKLPENAQISDIEAAGPDVQRSIIDFSIRLETLGYMVFRRNVELRTVDDLIGGITLAFWSRGKSWIHRERERTATPKYGEWCEWLAERITERRQRLGHKPAYILYTDWRE